MLLMQALVAAQEDFFRYGNKGLHPLTMEQVAEALSLHVSTVSRAARSKYFCCEWGTFQIKMLFLRGSVFSQTRQAVYSADQLRELIRGMIEHENKDKPLSDQQIAERLTADFIPLSRRCVAKYRAELSIPSSWERKSASGIS